MEDELYNQIKEKAYFISLYKDRNRIKHTQEEDWLHAEEEIIALKNLSISYLKRIWNPYG